MVSPYTDISIKILFLFVFAACNNEATIENKPSLQDSIIIRDSVIETVPTLPEESGNPSREINTDTTTYIYYGSDYEGDTVIYTKGAEILKEGIQYGEFVKTEAGDYPHIIIKDSSGLYHHFFVFLTNKKMTEKYWEGYTPRSRHLKIHWKREHVKMESMGEYYLFGGGD
ncbi:MAG: hypothetical protein K0S32_3721 [Bacteroidetes bacterium]|nr:hypothetical protein [Bacteroidota bacterium]